VSALASEVYTAGLLTGDAVAATIAHEVKQPLSGMITNADAGLRWLDHSTPNVDKAKAAFEQIVADGHRAAAVIESIRAIFRNDARNRTSLDVNEMIGAAVAVLRADLRKQRILVQAAPNAEVPQVRGDRIQLQQVLLNLITNAIDAMATKDGARLLRVRSEVNDAGGVIVSVADNGPGIGPQELEQIFNRELAQVLRPTARPRLSTGSVAGSAPWIGSSRPACLARPAAIELPGAGERMSDVRLVAGRELFRSP
jgi:C4-dicarboxylate-specific signal transduction histidine kinase